MSRLSDQIEKFIQALMAEEAQVDLKRNELAEYFRCAPSQINYVLSTRFTLDKGYIIQSRRGGGGYVRVIRMRVEPEEYLLTLLRDRLSREVTQEGGYAILNTLIELGWLENREARLISCMMRDEALSAQGETKDIARANMLRALIIEILRSRTEE